MDYVGVVHTEAETNEASDYDISLDREDGISVDASTAGNEARMCNDYRGVASRPNASFERRTSSSSPETHRSKDVPVRMALYSLVEIKRGDEVLVSYGKGFWANRVS